MFRRPLVFKSQPPVLKALRKHYTLHRRYLATSLKEQDQAKKVTSILAALVDQLDDASDSDEEDEIQEDIDQAEMMLEELVFEKVDDPEMNRTYIPIDITIDSLDPKDVDIYYRFRTKAHLKRVFNCLQLPARCGPLSNGRWIDSEALFLFYLRRLSSVDTLYDMVNKYGFNGDVGTWCRGFKWFSNWLEDRWGHKLTNNMDYWAPFFPHFSECIRKKAIATSANFPNLPTPLPPITWWDVNGLRVCCFVDNNQVKTCRPGAGPGLGPGWRTPLQALIQRSFYNGWARAHGIKFETLDAPNGMTMWVYGPGSLRQNDLWMIGRSGLNIVMMIIQTRLGIPDALHKLIYGDSIYVWMTHVRSRHGVYGTPNQRAEDKAMSACSLRDYFWGCICKHICSKSQ